MIFFNSVSNNLPEDFILFMSEEKLSIFISSASSSKSSEYPIIVFKGVRKANSISLAIEEIDFSFSTKTESLKVFSIESRISSPAVYNFCISGIK